MTTPSSDVSRALGRSTSAERAVPVVREDVPVPVAAVPRTTFRSRLAKLRQRREGSPEDDDVRRALGENTKVDQSLIPDDAESVEGRGSGLPKPLKPVKDVVMEPSDPAAEPEELLSPVDALVAPDATPDAFEPLDPARVPQASDSKAFTVRDLGKPAGRPGPGTAPPAGLPPTQHRQPEQQPEITTEQAYRMLHVQPPAAQHLQETAPSGQALLKQGEAMPEHKTGDIRSVMSAFRSLVG